MERTKDLSFFGLRQHEESPRFSECGRKAERPIDYFHEASFFAENETFALRHGEILPRFRI
jgi:hypothetical protein